MKSNYQSSRGIYHPTILDQTNDLSQGHNGSPTLTSPDGRGAPINTLIDSWLETKRSSQTRRAYRRDVVDFCIYVGLATIADLQMYPIAKLSHLMLEWLKTQYRTDAHNPDKVLNATTINRKAYAVSSWFEYLMAVYQYPKNPAKIFTAIKTVKHSSTESLTKLEYVRLLDYQKEAYMLVKAKSGKLKAESIIKELRDYLILSLLCMSLRRNEVAKLMWDTIDHTTPHITVTQKGGSTKLIPLPSSVYALLLELQNLKTAHGLIGAYIFSPIRNNSTGDLDKPISTDHIFQLIVQLTGLCGIHKNITPHSLRKTFIELALDGKQDYINIANATGHSTLEMIKYYDTRSKLEKNAINDMDVF